jgi:hypothetical protein
MAEHHKYFPPSSSSRWLTCTASVLPISELTEDRNSGYPAAEGTYAHAVFADILQSRAAGIERTIALGDTATVDGHAITLTHSMEDHLQEAIAYVDSLGPGIVLVEQSVSLPLAAEEPITGHADVIIRLDDDPHTVHVLDLKFGRRLVEVEHNTQMMLYGAASLSTFDMVFEDVSYVTLHVVQPRIGHFDAWTVDVQELAQWVASDVNLAVKQALVPELAQFAPSAEACQWCPLQGDCSAAREHALRVFDVLPDTLPEIESVDSTTLAQFLADGPFIEKALKAARKTATDRLLSGEEMPGWKLVTPAHRAWDVIPDSDSSVDVKAVTDAIALFSPTIDPWTDPVLKTAPAIAKEVGGKQFRDSAAGALVRLKQGAPTLARASDKRTEYIPVDPFNEIIEE